MYNRTYKTLKMSRLRVFDSPRLAPYLMSGGYVLSYDCTFGGKLHIWACQQPYVARGQHAWNCVAKFFKLAKNWPHFGNRRTWHMSAAFVSKSKPISLFYSQFHHQIRSISSSFLTPIHKLYFDLLDCQVLPYYWQRLDLYTLAMAMVIPF